MPVTESTAWTTAAVPSLAQSVVVGSVVLAVLAIAMRHGDRPAHAEGDKPPIKPRKIHSLDTTIPIIGDLLLFTRNAHRKHDFALELCLRFNGEPWQGHIVGMPPFVNFSDPKAIEAITATHFDSFAKGPFQRDVLQDLLSRGIVASDGERWYHQRKTAARFFAARTLRECVEHIMQRNMALVYEAIDAAMKQGKLVDLSHLFHQFTLQTFAEAGLGVSIPLIGQKRLNDFEHALDEAMPIMSRRGRLPPILWKLERWLGVGEEKKLADAMKIVHNWLDTTIQHSLEQVRQRQQRGEVNAHGESIMELFVRHSGEDTDGLKPEDLSDFILNFVIAARDTSALTLSWFFYALGQHPEVVAAIRSEMIQKIDPNMKYVTAEHVKSLTYLEATIKETLRLYPAGPNTVKQVMRDTVICGDIFLKKGMMIGINAWALARNPRVWGPDAAKFKPERWIDNETGNIVQVPVYKFFSFHAGPRSCVGVKLAMLNLRVVSANLLHRYTVQIDPSNDGSYLSAPTLAMKHPLLATMTPVVAWT